MITLQKQYRAAIYCRLSVDDGNVGESGSILTQKNLLTNYCNEHHFNIAGCYCDDGWSGTNFERPEFKRMIADIENGAINLVVVKDLSRFGREYAQMGLYIEHYFEENNIRFIAVGENIDTINGTDNILMPITNVINSLYARDCSRKTKAAHRSRALAGMYMGGHAPFGYIKDPDDRHRLLIDPAAATIVRDLFKMFGEGIGYVRMTKILRERNVLNPQAYFNQNNPDFYQSDYWRKQFDWHATSIRTILNNPVYLGKTVFGRTQNKGFYQKKRIAVDEENWIMVEGTHEAIITQETWDLAHKLMENRRRESTKGEIQMFAGLVKCSHCGSSLNASYNAKKQKYTGFSCWVYKNYGKERCTSHAIGWQTMCTLVLENIQFHAGIAARQSQVYLDMLTEMKEAKRQEEVNRIKKELKSVDKRLAQLDKILSKLYEDYALDKIDESRYNSMSSGYVQESSDLKQKQISMSVAIQKADEAYSNVQNFVQLIKRYTDVKELDTKILNELIDKIVVYEKEILPGGSKAQRVDIYYKFIGAISLEQLGLKFVEQELSPKFRVKSRTSVSA